MNKKMLKLLVFAAIVMYMVVPAAFADDVAAGLGGDDVALLNNIAEDSDAEDASEAGVTPDSPFYGMDVAMDNIGLMFTFNKAKKAEKKLLIANERLKEAKMMGLKNNLDAMEKARARHDEMLLSAEDDIDAIGTGDEAEALKTNMKIKTMLQMHKQEVSDVEQELTLRVRGRLTVNQQEKLDAFLESMKGSLSSVDVKVQNRGEKIKAVMKRTHNMSDAEIEGEFENYSMEAAEEHLGDKAENLISQAEKAIVHAEDLIAKKEEAGRNVTYAKEQLEDAKMILAEAKAEYEDGNIEDAVGLAFKAKRLAIYAASGFSIEKLMNTPMKDDPEFNEMKNRIVEKKEEKIRQNWGEGNGGLSDDDEDDADGDINDTDDDGSGDDNETCNNSVSGFAGAQIAVDDFSLTDAGILTLYLNNTAGGNITISEINLNASTVTQGENDWNVSVSGAVISGTAGLTGLVGSCFSYDLEIQYLIENVSHTASGKLDGAFE